MSGDVDFRAAVWRAHGAGPAEVLELLEYAENPFYGRPAPPPEAYPLADEPFVIAWERYAQDAEREGAAAVLPRMLVQLRFPIREGISATAAYRASVRAGAPPPPGPGLAFKAPLDIRLFLHPTPAGRIPVVLAGHRADYVTLVRALTRQNEPVPVPDSLGAVMVAGYNNWDRVAEIRRAWARSQPDGGLEHRWREEFRRLIPRRELYQDRFILLSAGPYSATPASALGMPAEAWQAASVLLRLEHECAHYFTRRVFGSMRNSLLDELIADYVGIEAAAGGFRGDWLLRFLGLEAYPAYRAGGRLENYRGTPPLSDGAWKVLHAAVHQAAHNLEALSSGAGLRLAGKAARIALLCEMGLERMVAPAQFAGAALALPMVGEPHIPAEP